MALIDTAKDVAVVYEKTRPYTAYRAELGDEQIKAEDLHVADSLALASLARDVEGRPVLRRSDLQREAFRRFLTTAVQPVADLVAEELSTKLDTEISFRFDGLYAHDLQGRATSFQKLVAGGMDVSEAVAVSGLAVPSQNVSDT